MHKLLLAVSSAALAMAAVPAAATIQIFITPGAVQPAENIQFQGQAPTGNNAFGVTNQTGRKVTFVGNEPLATPSQGQARVEAADGGLSQLSFGLDTGFGFKEVEFNIFGTGATATQTVLNFTDQFGTVFSRTVDINNGQNFFSARALDTQFITNVSFTLNGDVRDARQFRLGGVGPTIIDPGGGAVPEPASWAMMMAGFGLIGATMRRRKALPTAAS
jgi:opacity protein-like surface antigen